MEGSSIIIGIMALFLFFLFWNVEHGHVVFLDGIDLHLVYANVRRRRQGVNYGVSNFLGAEAF